MKDNKAWFKAPADGWERLAATLPRVWPIPARLLDVEYHRNRARMGQQMPTHRELAERWGCSHASVARTIKNTASVPKAFQDRSKSVPENSPKPLESLDTHSADRSKTVPKAFQDRSKGARLGAYQEENRKETLSIQDKGFLSTDKVKEKRKEPEGEPTPWRGSNPPTDREKIATIEDGIRWIDEHRTHLAGYDTADRASLIRYVQTRTTSATTVIKAIHELGGWSCL